MGRHLARIGQLTIPNGQSDSPGISTLDPLARPGVGSSVGLLIAAPATLPETITVEILPFGSATWRTLQSAGADVTIAAGKAVVIAPTPFADLRLHSGVAVAGDRTFDIDSQIDAGAFV